MRLRSKFAVKCAKATSSLIKKLNRGSGVTLPGYVARLIDPNILKELSGQVRKKTIVTMGTNGKTTTNAILCKALEHEGQKVIINRTGANMLNGIISAFVLATDKHGNLDADYACIEVDEIASVGVLPKIEPDCALLTNISRDQLDRFGEVDTIKRVQNGQYRTTQLVGTSESAAAFNAKAPSQGVTKVMKDSGISTKDTTRVSNKFNGVQSSTGIANAAKSSAKLGGAFGGGMAAVESIVNGDDLSTTTGNVASGALKGSVSGAAGTAASEATMAALAAAPIPLAAKVVIGIGAGMFAGSVASDVISDVCDGVGDIVSGIVDGIGDFFGSLFL